MNVFPGTPEYDVLPCCIQLEQRSPSFLIQNTLGPYTIKEAEDWLRASGFEQMRANLWRQTVPMTMNYSTSKDINLNNAKAWVYLLHKPEEIGFKKL